MMENTLQAGYMQSRPDIKKSSAFKWLTAVLFIAFFLKVRNNAVTETLTGGPGGIWNICFLFFYAVFLFSFSLSVFREIPALKFAFFYSFIAVISAFINIRSFSAASLYDIVTIPYFLVIAVVFFKAAKKRFSMSDINFILMLDIALICFVLWHLVMETLGGVRRYVVTDVYFGLAILPFALMTDKKYLRIICILLTATALILSGKRVGTVAYVVCMLMYYIISKRCGNGERGLSRAKPLNRFLSAALIVAAYALIFFYLTDTFNLRLVERLKDAFVYGEGGRDIIYGTVWRSMKSASLSQWLIGHGAKSVPVLMGSKNALAHCDFLEILYDYGVIALTAYIAFCASLVGKAVKLYKERSAYCAPFAASVITLLFLTTFDNYVIETTYITFSAMTWAATYSRCNTLRQDDKRAVNNSCDQYTY